MNCNRFDPTAIAKFVFNLITVLGILLVPAFLSEFAVAQANEKSGFTFFDVDRQSVYQQGLRRQLEDRLGNSAIERRNIINLEVHPKDILRAYFPQLTELNRRLNSPIGERVEHDTIKLMFRYARNKNLPFSHVEIVFSNASKNPLFIMVQAKNDISGIKDTLKDKYGPSRTIPWDDAAGVTDVWEHEKEILLFSVFPNRIGIRQYRIAIYYTENIEIMLKQEESVNKKTESGRKGAAGDAF